MEVGPPRRRDHRVTINDVAAATGVAASTVSRALSKPGRVNPATRARIEAAARRLNYLPVTRARALTVARTSTVAVLVSDITNPFFFGFMRSSQQHLKAAGFAQLLIDTEDSARVEGELLDRVRGSIDGAILAASRLPDRVVARIAEVLPVITLNRSIRGVPGVLIDTPGGIAHAVEHLVALGHRDIVYLSGPETSWANEARWRATQSALAAHELTPRRIGPFPPSRAGGGPAADALVRSAATACIAFNDLLAIGTLTRLRERGVRIPDDVSVVGCDDSFGADLCQPGLTTLTAPMEQAGRVAVAMMLAAVPGHATPPPTRPVRGLTVLPTQLTVRGSTGPAVDRRGGRVAPAPSVSPL